MREWNQTLFGSHGVRPLSIHWTIQASNELVEQSIQEEQAAAVVADHPSNSDCRCYKSVVWTTYSLLLGHSRQLNHCFQSSCVERKGQHGLRVHITKANHNRWCMVGCSVLPSWTKHIVPKSTTRFIACTMAFKNMAWHLLQWQQHLSPQRHK